VSEQAHPPVIEADPARPAGEAQPEREKRSFRSTVYHRRFAAIYLALAVLAGAAISALLIVSIDPGSTPSAVVGPSWSHWAPEGPTTDTRAQEIANHITRKYHQANGQVLTGALVGPPAVTSNQPEGSTKILVSAIAISPDLPAGGQHSFRDLVVVNAANHLQFVVCGFGQNCSIASGAASEQRFTLLRRQALELALFTFKYMPRIDSVSVFMPPPPGGETAGTTIFIRRNELGAELQRPLSQTLSEDKAPEIGHIPPKEIARINRLTRQRIYQYGYTQAQDGSAVLLLDPVRT
jgi:hypothetical protein